jgi:nitroreductase
MDYEGFIEIVRSRRSIRSYKPDPVDDGLIEKIVEAGKWAPSGNNTQPLEIVVVKEKTLVEQIEELTRQNCEPKLGQHFGTPVMLAVLGDPRLCDAYPKGLVREEILHASLSAAIENMLLAATVVGLGGSVWKTVSPSAAVKIKELLGIPMFYILKALLPLGFPKGDTVLPSKRDVVIHENRFDINKLKDEKEISGIMNKYCIMKELNKIRYL